MIIEGSTLNGVRVVDGSVITQNLAIYIDANNSSSYPGTGTSVSDLSGNGRTQLLASASQYTVLSGIKCFNCNSTYMVAASATPVLPTTGFTYICWARMKSSTADWRTLYRSTPDDHALLVEIGTNRLGMYNNPTGSFYPSGYTVEKLADVWTQWVVSGDSSGQTFYINGQQVGTVSGQTAAGNSHQYIAAAGTGQYFGYIANMLLYTTKLTQEQIQQNYYGLKGRFGV